MRKTISFLRALIIAGFFVGSLSLGAGCDNDIDPDSLVRELRVLGMRFGDPQPGSSAEVQATLTLSASGMPELVFAQPSFRVAVLAVAPTGPGRRVAVGPRPLRYDFYTCVGPLSLFSPGTIDTKCLKFAPGDPPPRDNPALRPLGAQGMGPSDGTLTLSTAELKDTVGPFLMAALAATSGQGQGTGQGGGLMLPSRPITLLIPILVQVLVPPPDGDPTNSLDSEVAYSFLRIVIALPGMALPPPNHNPILSAEGALSASPISAEDASEQRPMMQLKPCSSAELTGPCERYSVSRTAPIYLTGRAADGSVETYTPLDDSGRSDVKETLRYIWFSTDGNFSEARTGELYPETRWQNEDSRPAPPETGVVDLWLVVQDERVGSDYQRFQLAFP